MGVTGQVKKFDSLAKIGFVSISVPFNLALTPRLLLSPLVRHFLVERRIHQTVEFIDIHGMDTIAQPLCFNFKALDRFVMLPPLVNMACVKRIAHPLKHLTIEANPPEHLRELSLDGLLADIFAPAISWLTLALIGVAGAMVIDVPFLLNLTDNGAAAGFAGNQA